MPRRSAASLSEPSLTIVLKSWTDRKFIGALYELSPLRTIRPDGVERNEEEKRDGEEVYDILNIRDFSYAAKPEEVCRK